MNWLVPAAAAQETQETQSLPPFVCDWTHPATLSSPKKFRSEEGDPLAPVVAIPATTAFRGFTIHDDAKVLLDPFSSTSSTLLDYAQSLYPRMPVRSTTSNAFEEPPEYTDAWLVSCIPHGISTDPRGIALLKKHKETDFFKCFFHSLLYDPSGCAGGWLLVPLAFFLGLNDTILRYTFLSKYVVTSLHLFDVPVLRNDPCVYVSFCFHKSAVLLDRQLLPWTFGSETRLFPVNKETDWVLCADLYRLPRASTVSVKRFFTSYTPRLGPVPGLTGLVLHATDSIACGTRISMTYEPHKQYGSTTSRNIATLLVEGCSLTEEEQQRIAEEFTLFLEDLRGERWSLFLSPMEETGVSRRRIPFKLAFVLLEHIVSKVKDLLP
jgi:hypothetical protein